jgi:outer membrane receptor protein involved in Fe transport
MNIISRKSALLCGAASIAMMGIVPANAQDSTAADEQVTVSASRISIAGYQQPTPVTVVGAAQLERDANTDIGNSIRELPALGASSGPDNGVGSGLAAGIAGEDLINLRNLGILRTLVLVDGQRVVPSNITGGVDISTIPATMVQRIDVVTGGASAAWGSDAIAGVVNLVLNKNFTGFKANIEGGDSWKDDDQKWKVEGAWGGNYLGGRLHFQASGQYQDSPNEIHPGQRAWYQDQELVNNPAYTATNGQPKLIHASNVGYSTATTGGVIVSNPAGVINGVTQAGTANEFANIQFLTGGTPAPFNAGNVSGPYSNGGNSDTLGGYIGNHTLTQNFRNATAFAYASYKITSDIQASLQLNYGKSVVMNLAVPATKLGNLTMKSDNAFLDPTIAAQMAAAGVTSFVMGTTNLNNVTVNTLGQVNEEQTVGITAAQNARNVYRGAFTLDGSLGENWSWNAYLQAGEARVRLQTTNNTFFPNYNNAIDAVRVTTANRGTSGLALGEIVCRNTLTNPTNGCVPLDIFGVGVASPAAIAYVTNVPDFEQVNVTENVAAASMQGTLPWGLPAGKVAVAFGAETRREAGRSTTDAAAIAVQFQSGNFAPFVGAYNVTEGFVEVDAPLLKDEFVESLDLSAAGRMTSYSTSGLVETWKLGLTSQVIDDVKLRTTWSYDIRAPDLSELYATGASTSGQGTDPRTGKAVNFFSVSLGNTALTPEASTTVSGGVVLTPRWVPNLTMSLDWYSINIKNAIATTGASQEIAQCAAGNQAFCNALAFNGPGGSLSQVFVQPLNTAAATTSGLDVAADYTHDLFDGTMEAKVLANYMDEETSTTLGVKYDYASSLGGDSPVTGGVPKFKATIAMSYLQNGWQVTAQSRLIGEAVLVNGWTNLNVDNNYVPFVAYADLRGSYKWNDHVQFYGAVDNVFNTPPPIIPTSSIGGSLPAAIRSDIYDVIGRAYRIGVRFNFN